MVPIRIVQRADGSSRLINQTQTGVAYDAANSEVMAILMDEGSEIRGKE